MTDTQHDSNTSTQCRSALQLDTLDQSRNNIRSSKSSSQQHQHQQYDTPRAKRFSQKLVDAVKRKPLERTPSTSASLSPPLENDDDDDDDDSMTDIDTSCFSSPNRDDHIMNNHFQNLMLSSPLRPDLTMMRPLSLDENQPSSTIPDDHSEPNGVLTRRRIRDKRPVKHQSTSSDSPSLSAKPKRRKLKQQRTTSWRMGADATLDTNKIHLPIEPSQSRRSSSPTSTSSQQEQQHGNTRRSSRLANRKVSYGENMGISHNKKPLVVLGVPGGIKTDSEQLSAAFYHDEIYRRRSVSNEQQKPARKIRRRVDTVEQRLNQLIFARDTLDLSKHSVLPISDDKAAASTQENPTVVVIDDSTDDETNDHGNDSQSVITITTESENADTANSSTVMETTNDDDEICSNTTNPNSDNDTLLNNVKLEPDSNSMNSSSSPQPTLSQSQHQVTLVSTETTIDDEDIDMDEVNERTALNEEPPPTQTEHTPDEVQVHDDDLDMADEQQILSIQDASNQQHILASTPSSPSIVNKDDQPLDTTTNIPSDHESNVLDTITSTIRAPSPSPATSPELNDPTLPPSNSSDDCSATNQDTTSTNGDNHTQPPASTSTSTSTTLPSPNLEATPTTPLACHITTTTPQLASNSHSPSQQAKDMYMRLANDENTAAAVVTTSERDSTTTPLTEDQSIATVSTNTLSATEMGNNNDSSNNNNGSSEGTTLFGRLIGSASHFFLGN